MLGHLYLSYEAISEDLFKSLYAGGKHLEEQVLDEISNSYRSMGYLLSARNVGTRDPSGTRLVRDENCKILPGIEYVDHQGNWSVPRRFLDGDCNACDYTRARWAYIHSYEYTYRFLFEVMTDFGLQRLHVPDSFYDQYCTRTSFFF